MNSPNKLMTIFFSMGIFALAVLLMVYAKSILLPLVIAFIVCYVINASASLAHNIRIANHSMPKSLCQVLAILLLLGTFLLLADAIKTNVADLSQRLPNIGAQITTEVNTLADRFHVSSASVREILTHVSSLGTDLLSDLTNSLADAGETMATVLLYLAFLLAEQHTFSKKMAGLFTDGKRHQHFLDSLHKIDSAVKSYLSIKTLAGIIAGTGALIVFKLVSLEFALFFAALIFLMNFIPFVGAIIGMLFPAIMALVQFDTLTPCLIIVGAITAIVFSIGNIFEPRMMGKTMNLSPLAILLALATFGTLWGITGMIVSVPITVTIMIASSSFPRTRGIAVLLSEKGELS